MNQVPDALSALDRALDETAAIPLSCLTPDVLSDQLVGLQTMRAKFDAVMCAATAEADRAAVQTVTGHRSLPSSIGTRAKCDSMPIARDRTLGRWVSGYPEIAAAFMAGRLTRRHVEALKALDNARTRAALFEGQAQLIDAAETCGWKDFTEVLRYWMLAADPDGLEPKIQKQNRAVSMRTRDDGMLEGKFLFDPLEGSAFRTALEFEIQRLFRHDAELIAAGEDRTPAQRRADALFNLITAGHEHRDGAQSRPLINIVMSEGVAADAIARLTDPEGVKQGDHPNVDPYELPIAHGDVNKRSELIDGTPIHPLRALPLLASAELRRMVMSTKGEVLDVGRKARNFPKALKQALGAARINRTSHCDSPPPSSKHQAGLFGR